MLFRFQKCSIPLNLLFPEGISEKRLFRDLFNDVFRNPYYGKYICYDGDLFLKMFKI